MENPKKPRNEGMCQRYARVIKASKRHCAVDCVGMDKVGMVEHMASGCEAVRGKYSRGI